MPGHPERRPIGTDLADDEREQAYSPSTRLPGRDFGPFIDLYISRSESARQQYPVRTLRYGPARTQTVDIVVPDPAVSPGTGRPHPIHVFIHGGYWQELSKKESLFSAREVIGEGTALAAVDYTLAPDATIDQIVDECCDAIRAIRSSASELSLDPSAMTVSGSSAGAHLAAMATLRLTPIERPRGLILLSGVYLLEPLIGTTINDALGLDAPTARSLSPLLHPLDGFPPTVVAYGDNETDEFKRHSQAMVDALTELGVAVSEVERPGRNHFDVVFDLAPELTDILAYLTG
jgi:arylformamidase